MHTLTILKKMEFKRTKHNNFTTGSKHDTGCKKHPRHKQSPGVCSVCLGERLSKLPISSSSKTNNKVDTFSSCSSSSSLSSCYSSVDGSPEHHKYRLGSMKNVTIMSGDLKGTSEDVFRKSRSVAAIERFREREGKDGNKKKKNGFWSKLLKLKKKKNEMGLVNSSMITTRVH